MKGYVKKEMVYFPVSAIYQGLHELSYRMVVHTCHQMHMYSENFSNQFLFSYNSNNQQSNENKTWSKISRMIERIDQVTSLSLTR